MKFAKQLEEYQSWQWRGQYFNYTFFKKSLQDIADGRSSAASLALQHEQKGFPKPRHSPKVPRVIRKTSPVDEQNKDKSEAIELWRQCVESEAMRLGSCISYSLQEYRDRLTEILALPAGPTTTACLIELRVLDALGQLEEQVANLRGFAEINHAALFKILKKHDKLLGSTLGLGELCSQISRASGLGNFSPLDILTEEVRAACMQRNPCHGQLSPAVARLAAGLVHAHGSSGTEEHLRRERYLSFFLGLCLALSASLLLLCALTPEQPETFSSAYFLSSFCVFRVVLSITLCFWGMGAVARFCEERCINHMFILDVHPRCRVGPQFLFSKAAVLTSLWIVFFGMYVVDYKWMVLPAVASSTGYNSRSSWHYVLYPVTIFVLTVAVLLAPSPVCRRTYGWQICRSIGRTFSAPFFPVSFGDNLVGDVMTSLTKPLQDIPASICYIMSHHPQVQSSVDAFTKSSDTCPQWEHDLILPLIAALPQWFRLLQCARRFRDTREGKHLCNLGKYAASLLVVVVSAVRGPSHIGVICISSVATVYAASWDILMDWGLTAKDLSLANANATSSGRSTAVGSSSTTTTSTADGVTGSSGVNPQASQEGGGGGGGGGAPLLCCSEHGCGPSMVTSSSQAKKRNFSPQFYWMAAIFDIMARLTWVLTLVPITLLSDDIVWRATFQISMSTVEIVRRCVWVVLRIENEQVTNASGYRALLWVPSRRWQVQLQEGVMQRPETAAVHPARIAQPPSGQPSLV